jgi:hypothetical protein
VKRKAGKKKAASKKKGSKGRKGSTGKDQLKRDLAAVAEIVMSILSNGLARPDGPAAVAELQAAAYSKLNEVRDRWGMQL